MERQNHSACPAAHAHKWQGYRHFGAVDHRGRVMVPMVPPCRAKPPGAAGAYRGTLRPSFLSLLCFLPSSLTHVRQALPPLPKIWTFWPQNFVGKGSPAQHQYEVR